MTNVNEDRSEKKASKPLLAQMLREVALCDGDHISCDAVRDRPLHMQFRIVSFLDAFGGCTKCPDGDDMVRYMAVGKYTMRRAPRI